MKDSEREKIKLTANYFNGLGVGLFMVAGIAPIVAFLRAGDYLRTGIVLVGALMMSVAAHLRALHLLERLDDKDT